MPQNYYTAVYWYRKAAAHGDAWAESNLGYKYQHGQGVPQNYHTAVYWYRKAAAQGDATAQRNLNAIQKPK